MDILRILSRPVLDPCLIRERGRANTLKAYKEQFDQLRLSFFAGTRLRKYDLLLIYYYYFIYLLIYCGS